MGGVERNIPHSCQRCILECSESPALWPLACGLSIKRMRLEDRISIWPFPGAILFIFSDLTYKCRDTLSYTPHICSHSDGSYCTKHPMSEHRGEQVLGCATLGRCGWGNLCKGALFWDGAATTTAPGSSWGRSHSETDLGLMTSMATLGNEAVGSILCMVWLTICKVHRRSPYPVGWEPSHTRLNLSLKWKTGFFHLLQFCWDRIYRP